MNGFTLIELLIVVAIVGILGAMAYPSYSDYVRRAHRADVTGLLSDTAQQLERFYSRHGQYSDVVGPPSATLEITAGNEVYRVEAERDARMFKLVATPIAGAVMDGDKCGIFIVDNAGRLANSGPAEGCWGR
ncbi:type IV pilin protein [Pseudomonas sp. NA-150]|uniref:type IV pilin protein n=1 Tax=Pseudomonas sp. NA-150 TaxID=3367525 RepID=UPI0037CC3F24